MRELVVGIMLCIQTFWDLRYKEIPSIVSAVGGLLGLCMWHRTDKNGIDILLPLLPGILCLFCGWISREAVGYGDGILLCVLGIYYTLEELVVIGMIAIGLAGGYGLILLVLFHKNGRYEIPFVPFLLLGWAMRIVFFNGGA